METIDNIYKKLDRLFPFKISDDFVERFGGRDNSGIIINTGSKIDKILWSLDFSLKAVKFAVNNNCNLIITHHPAIYNGVLNIDILSPDGQMIIECIKNGISVISMHLNLDMATDGVDETLTSILNPKSTRSVQTLRENIGYGKIFEVEKTSLKSIEKLYSNHCKTDKTIIYGDSNTLIKKVATFCGGGFEESFFKYLDVDLIITSDLKHHIIKQASERNICVLIIPHYAAENFSFNKIYFRAKDILQVDSLYFEDKYFL